MLQKCRGSAAAVAVTYTMRARGQRSCSACTAAADEVVLAAVLHRLSPTAMFFAMWHSSRTTTPS